MELLEEQERQARAVAGVSHLEIPAQLAYIYSKLDEWQPPHSERHLVNVVGNVVPRSYDFDLPRDVNSHIFSKYVNIYFKRKWQMKKQPIDSPFLGKHLDADTRESLALFKLVLRFMNDATLTGKREKVLADYIIQRGLSHEVLRDEIIVQLVNQTWRNKNDANAERGWLLMVCALSCFSPSSNLATYLLKHASDQAYNGYKAYIQHKLLQCILPEPCLPRSYPPCLLEWKAAKKHANMAVEAMFPDGETAVGPVESWTTGEEFASHLLQCRQVRDGHHGWTVVLKDEVDYYELNGYDYVLDLISEVEVAPAFPYTQAHFIVTTDRTDRSQTRRQNMDGLPHDPEANRDVPLMVEELLEPIPVEPRAAPEPQDFFKYRNGSVHEDSLYASRDEALSKTSALNKRRLGDDPLLAQGSALNVRYIDQRRVSDHNRPSSPVPPGSPSLSAEGRRQPGSPGPQKRQSHHSQRPQSPSSSPPLSPTSKLNHRYGSTEIPQGDAKLAGSKLNQRYSVPSKTNGQVPNGHLPNGNTHNGDVDGELELAGDSLLNRRYKRQPSQVSPGKPQPSGHASRDHIMRKQRAFSSNRSDTSEGARSSGPTDMDQWLDNVFDPILDGDLDELSDGRSLENRIRGGGEGVPGVSQPPPAPVSNIMATGLMPPTSHMSQPSTVPTFSSPATGSIPIGNLQVVNDPTSQLLVQAQQLAQQQAAQQLAAQQMAQQQAYLVGFPPPALSPTSPTVLPPVLQTDPLGLSVTMQQTANQLHQQNAALQIQLERQSLQNKLLQQTMENEQLRKQIEQNHGAKRPPMVNGSAQPVGNTFQFELQPAGPANGAPVSPRSPRVPPKPMGKAASHQKASGEIDDTRPGGVRTLKGKYEKAVTQQLSPTLYRRTTDVNGSDTMSNDSKVKFNDEVKHIPRPDRTSHLSPSPSPSPPLPPPPPPPPNQDRQPPTGADDTESTKSSVPPAPPPPPVPKIQEREPNEPYTIRGKDGRARVIRVGKIQWPPPPPPDEEEKPKIHVGKLQIDEKKIKDAQPMKSKEDVHNRAMAIIRSRNKDAPEEPEPKKWQPPQKKTETPADKPTASASSKTDEEERRVSSVDMQSRKKELEKKLNQAGFLKGSTPAEPPAVPAAREPSFRRSVQQQEDEDEDDVDAGFDLRDLERVRTELYSPNTGPYFTYNRVPWSLNVRKEIFTPTERIENPLLINLVFCQIVQDVYSKACIRISKDDRMRMKSFLESHRITPRNMLDNHHKAQVKKLVIDKAREWPLYFARLFPVNGGRLHPRCRLVGVSHQGVSLIAREKDLFDDTLHTLHFYRFEEIVDVSVPKPSALQLHVNNKYIIVYTPRANQIKSLIEAYCIETEKNVMFVRAIKSYITRESTLLSFREGDIIKLTNRDMTLDKGWLYGSLNGRAGMFPAEYIVPLARHEVEKLETQQRDGDHLSEASVYNSLPEGGKYSMLEFAMLHFRQSPFRYEMIRSEETGSIHGTFKLISSLKARTMQRENSRRKGKVTDWTWKEQVDMIKWSRSPIQASLLKFESPPINKLSIECFIAIMRYMGDYPLARGQKPIDCVYAILKANHTYPELRDEVYCQLAKQATNNRSTKPESLQQAWRMMCIVSAYFDCTDILKPYLFKFLEQTAYDNQRPHQAIAAQCLQNLRTTFRFGGRKNVPSRVEVEALTRGRNTKRQMCVLPGGVPVVLNVRSCSVVMDAIDQICHRLDVDDSLQKEEFTIFYVIEAENRYCPLNRDEYIFDITTELANQKKEFYLLFQRTSWNTPLHLDNNNLYIDVMYHQCIPDFIDGFLLPLPTNSLPDYIKDELCMLAALQIKAGDIQGLPPQKEVMSVIPKTAHNITDMKTERWVHMVHAKIREIDNMNPQRSKILFLDILSRWPLFGCTFFSIKGVADPRVKSECLLAVGKNGVHFLHSKTHETLIHYPFSEVISTRRFKHENGGNFLDMKVGNLMVQKITRLETDQGADISALIGQYIHIINKSKNRPR